MTTITVAPNLPEWGLGREQYKDFVAALRAEGYDAVLQEPSEREQRGLGGDVMLPLSIYLGARVAEAAIDAIVALAFERLRRPTKAKRETVVWGPDDEVLRRVEFPNDGD